jgi:hypothetical protein
MAGKRASPKTNPISRKYSGQACNEGIARAFAVILLIAASPALFAQSSAPLPGCEPRPKVRRTMDERLAEKALLEMKFGHALPSAGRCSKT